MFSFFRSNREESPSPQNFSAISVRDLASSSALEQSFRPLIFPNEKSNQQERPTHPSTQNQVDITRPTHPSMQNQTDDTRPTHPSIQDECTEQIAPPTCDVREVHIWENCHQGRKRYHCVTARNPAHFDVG